MTSSFEWKLGHVILCPSTEELAQVAAEHIARSVSTELTHRPRFHLSLAGGNTPAACYRQLAVIPLEWSRVVLSLGDERCLPWGHPERNESLVRDTLVDPAGAGAARFESVPAELGAEEGSQQYARILTQLGPPNLALLGLGEDGHTASLFPGNPALALTEAAVPVHGAPKSPADRISMGLGWLQQAQERIFLVTGASKRAILRELSQGAPLPAALVGSAYWYIEESAWPGRVG
ncbi:MAG: 6-phosphogluconolactonase [Ferrovum sp.]|nr:6-phosphogluconolactonase [Ferrovum sp.]NDU87759.1 6-phosphogluconolactonase [Ferrovum sp.]